MVIQIAILSTFLIGAPFLQAQTRAFLVPSRKPTLRLEPIQHHPLPFGQSWDMVSGPKGKRLYIANGRGGLVIVDVSKPERPKVVGRSITGGTQFKTIDRTWILDFTREARAVRWIDNEPRLYIQTKGYDSKHWKEMVFDLKNEELPIPLTERFIKSPPARNEATLPAPVLAASEELIKSQKLIRFTYLQPWAFVLNADGLMVYEWKAEKFEKVSSLVLAGNATAVDLRDGKVWAPAGPAGLWGGSQKKSGRGRLAGITEGTVLRSQLAEGLLYAAAGEAGLKLFESTGKDWTLKSTFRPANGSVQSVVVSGATAFLAVNGLGLAAVDVSSPASPKLLSTFIPPLPPSMGGVPEDRDRDTALDVAIAGDTAYLANGRSGLFAVDIQDPRAPKMKSHFWDTETGRMVAARIWVDGQTLYLADWDNGVYVFDISDQGIPRKKSLYHTGQAYGLCIDGERLWVADGGYGLKCMDKATGQLLFEHRDPDAFFLDVRVEDDVVYTAEGWRMGAYRIRKAKAGTAAAFAFDTKGGTKPLLDKSGEPIKPAEISTAYGKEFVIKEDGRDVCESFAADDWQPHHKLRPIYQELSDEAGWPDISVKPMRLAIDPKLGRFKFSDGLSGSKLLGHKKLAIAIPNWFRVKGSFVYFGADEGNNFWAVDVSDPRNPKFVGNGCTSGFTKNIDVEADAGYAANGMGQVAIFDLKDCSNPDLVSYLNLPGAYHPEADGNRLYVSGAAKLHVFDVSDIFHPKRLAEPFPCGRAIAEGGLVYLMTGNEVQVMDWTDPSQPKTLWTGTDVGAFDAKGRELAVWSKEKWTLISFENPAKPSEVQSVPMQQPGRRFDWDDQFVYQAIEGDIVITTRATGKEVGRAPKQNRPVTLGFGGGTFGYMNLQVRGDLLYAIDLKVGLVIFDVKDRTAPEKLSEFLVLGGDYTGIAYDEKRQLAWSATNWGGLHLVNLSDPAKPKKLAWHQMEGAVGPTLSGTLYFGNNAGGLCIADVTDPLKAKITGRFDTGRRGDPRLGGANFSVRRENLLYLPHRCTILDVSNPSDPKLVGRMPESEKRGESAYTIWVLGNYAYLGGSPHFQIVDISDPANPKEVGRLTLDEYQQPGWSGYYFGRGIHVRGDYVYVLTRPELIVIDVKDKTTPRKVGAYELPGFCSDLDVVGDYVYVAGYYGGLHVLDISNPERPTLVDHFQQGVFYDKGGWDNVGCYQTIVVTPDHALVNEFYSGLLVIQVPYSSQAPKGRVTVERAQ